MTETERYVNRTCERIVASGHAHLYKDLYKDLRQRMPCGVACRLIEAGLRLTRSQHLPVGGTVRFEACVARSQAIAALRRLERYSDARDMAAIEEHNAALVWWS